MRHPYRLTTQMALCELELKPLLKRVNELGRVSPVPQFPLVRRDIALVAAKSVANAAIEKVIRDNGGKELVKVTLFDVFKDSRAYSLEFRSAERTLTDEEVGRAFQRIVDALKATAGIEVRES
jgi:phenylalanyl-tRNA synthetase beta chain